MDKVRYVESVWNLVYRWFDIYNGFLEVIILCFFRRVEIFIYVIVLYGNNEFFFF